MMSVRPLAKTLSVSQGKGYTALLAKISAAMEAIELWHAENVRKPFLAQETPAWQMDLPYRVADLVSESGALVTEATLFDWIESVGILSGCTVPVPSVLVTIAGHDESRWSPPGLTLSSNGLASGNTRGEAGLHALYEIVERDALRNFSAAVPPDHVDLDSIEDEGCSSLVEQIKAAGAKLTVTRIPSRFDVPCFEATVWGADFSAECVGSGAHLDAYVALSRAITEAAQSRLTGIAGSRDDLPSFYRQVRLGAYEPKQPDGRFVRWEDLQLDDPYLFDDVTSELAWLGNRVRQVTGFEPLLSDLSTTTEFAVVRVIVPATAVDREKIHRSH
jgi:ribosomal protein S12 methylthiotransferase accessory factor